jgi:hypothetical protein
MFNDEFYPTPTPVIQRMVAPLITALNGRREYKLHGFNILEPSAGKGNILDALATYYRADAARLYAVEINPELRVLLSGKGYRVIGSDFLDFDEPYHFDYIIMNPPFSKGAEHLLKAWDVVGAGGHVVCLLNAETIRNPHTEQRKLLLRTIQQHGRYEYIGQVFTDAERKTGVDCAIVWLDKPAADRNHFEGATFEQEARADDPEFTANPLVQANVFEALVNRYKAAARMLVERYRIDSEYAFYTDGILKAHEKTSTPALNDALNALKASFWQYVFDKTRLGEITTSKFQAQFREQSSKMAQMQFSVANILEVLELFMANKDSILHECIVNVFDELTRYHKDNTAHTEGWKSNKAYRVNAKLVIPYGVEFSKWGSWMGEWRRRELWDDLDKALCLLSGRKIADVQSITNTLYARINAINGDSRLDYAEPFRSEFFEIRIFKKGTVHLKFLDKALLDRFNIVASDGLNNRIGAGV